MPYKKNEEWQRENAELQQQLADQKKTNEQLQSQIDTQRQQGPSGTTAESKTVVVEAGQTFKDGVKQILDRLAPTKPPLVPVGEISSERRLAVAEMRASLRDAFKRLDRHSLDELARRAEIPEDEIGNSSDEQLAEKLADRPSPPQD